MMDLIYSCSWVTIVALHSDNADTGLCGLSSRNPRAPQRSENVEGSQLLSLFPVLHQELMRSTYNTRAWTLQELILCSRRILFGKHQIHFSCNTANHCESIDDTSDPGGVLDKDPKQGDFFLLVSPLNHTAKRRKHISLSNRSRTIKNTLKMLDLDVHLLIPLSVVWLKCIPVVR